MLKGRVVLDTNIIISFLLTRGKSISSIFNSWNKEEFDLLISEEIFKEIATVLEYEKIKKLINPWEKAALLEKLKLQTVHIKGKTEANNNYIECAIDGIADFIVSGDKHVLDLKKYQWIKILTPKEFVLAHDRKNKNGSTEAIRDR